MSAILLAGAALLYARRMRPGRNWHVPVGLILLAVRELDFDKRFTSEGVLQLRLYSGDNPLWEKAIGAAIVILALVVLFLLARFQFVPWLRGLAKGMAWAWLFALSGFLIVVAKSLDGIGRKLAPLGIEVPQNISDASSRVEEVFELFFAFCIIASLMLAPRTRNTDKCPH